MRGYSTPPPTPPPCREQIAPGQHGPALSDAVERCAPSGTPGVGLGISLRILGAVAPGAKATSILDS